jgi:hypothetical protein
MFDDGNHGDGNAGDNIFGAAVTLNGVTLEYYIYAENSTAGMFSPQRAEHEYHSLAVALPLPAVGNILINELMASNGTTAYDNYGENDDWFELFNITSITFDLTGLYLSDDPTNLMKWQIPVGTVINANDVLVFWADNDVIQSGLHASFKLGASGESLYLSDGTTVYDFVDFGVQTTDVSYARCPDGQTFTYAGPTFDALNNCYLSLDESEVPMDISLFPNPTREDIQLRSGEDGELKITVIDLQGRVLTSLLSSESLITVGSSQWSSGYYQVFVESSSGKYTTIPFIKE